MFRKELIAAIAVGLLALMPVSHASADGGSGPDSDCGLLCAPEEAVQLAIDQAHFWQEYASTAAGYELTAAGNSITMTASGYPNALKVCATYNPAPPTGTSATTAAIAMVGGLAEEYATGDQTIPIQDSNASAGMPTVCSATFNVAHDQSIGALQLDVGAAAVYQTGHPVAPEVTYSDAACELEVHWTLGSGAVIDGPFCTAG